MPGWPRFRGSFTLVKMSSRNVPADFCSGHYKVVRVKAEPQSPNWLVHCKVCKEPKPIAASNVTAATTSHIIIGAAPYSLRQLLANAAIAASA